MKILVMINTMKKMVRASPAFKRMTGYPILEAIGETLSLMQGLETESKSAFREL